MVRRKEEDERGVMVKGIRGRGAMEEGGRGGLRK